MSEIKCKGCKAKMDKVHDDKARKLQTLKRLLPDEVRSFIQSKLDDDPPELVMHLGPDTARVRIFAQTEHEQGFLICHDTPQLFQHFRMADNELQAVDILSEIAGMASTANIIPMPAKILMARLAGALAYTNKLPFPMVLEKDGEAFMQFYERDRRLIQVVTDTERSGYKFKVKWDGIETEGWTNSPTRLAEDLERYLDSTRLVDALERYMDPN